MGTPVSQYRQRYDQATAADATSVVSTIAASGSDETVVIDRVYCSFDTASSANPASSLTIVAGSTTLFDGFLHSDDLHPVIGPFYNAAGETVVTTMTSGGSGVAGKLNVVYHEV